MHVDTDLLLIGGGSAGCLAAIAARAHSLAVAVTILEKGGDLSRSSSMARGMDGLNIVVQPGHATPEEYVEEYVNFHPN